MAVTKRRQYGTGSVYQRASDGKWCGSIQAGWRPNGRPRVIVVYGSSEADVKRRVRDRIKALEAGGVTDASARATVKSWAEQWIATRVHTVRPKTWSTYRTQITKWIVPTIGHKRLGSLTPADIRSVTTAIRDADLSSSTARHAHAVLIRMLRDATAEGHQVPPRILLMDAPAPAAHDREAIPVEDAIALLHVAASRADRSRWAAALLQGMRQGECLGLTWARVDLDSGTLDISWQLQAIPYEHGCGPADGRKRPCGRRFGGDCPQRTQRVPDGYEVRRLDGALSLVRPKTSSGQRIIPLVPWMHSALQEWQTVAPHSPHDLVWPRLDGRPQLAADDAEDWKALQSLAEVQHPAGRPYVLHEARHTTATLLMASGIEPTIITAILGHSVITTSRAYMHADQTMARKAMEEVAARLQLG